MKTAFSYLSSLGGWAFFAVMVWGAVTLYYFDARLGTELQREFGFTVSSPYSKGWGEILRIESVKHGGILWQAGVRSGDVVVDMRSTSFYRLLDRARHGHQVSFNVASWNEGKRVERDSWRSVALAVENR